MQNTIPIDFVVASDLPDTAKYRGLTESCFDIDCPFCGGHRKLHVHRVKNVFRCNKCGECGNALTLHSLLINESCREKALADLKKRFSGLEPDLQVTYMSPVKEEKVRLADIEMRDHVNKSLLEKLTLSRRHHDDLIHRGLTEVQIKECGYKSVPSSAAKAKQIANEVLEPQLMNTIIFFIAYPASVRKRLLNMSSTAIIFRDVRRSYLTVTAVSLHLRQIMILILNRWLQENIQQRTETVWVM